MRRKFVEAEPHYPEPSEMLDQLKGDRRPLKHDAEEQTQLDAMLRYRTAGLGALRVARELNIEFPASPRTGRKWTAEQVAVVFRSYDRRASALTAV